MKCRHRDRPKSRGTRMIASLSRRSYWMDGGQEHDRSQTNGHSDTAVAGEESQIDFFSRLGAENQRCFAPLIITLTEQQARRMSKSTSKNGKVYLIGAGPGDLGLVTLRAKECIEDADV